MTDMDRTASFVELCDRIFVIRLGREAGNLVTRETTVNDVVSPITGVPATSAAPAPEPRTQLH